MHKTKIKYVVFLIGMFFLNTVRSQTNHRIDSLKAILLVKQQDSVVVKTLNSLATIYIDVNSDTAILYSKKAEIKADESKNSVFLSDTYLTAGLVYSKLHQPIISIDFYSRAKATLSKNRQQKKYALACFNLGYGYRFTGDYKQAIDNYNEALEVYTFLQAKEEIADCHVGLAVLYSNLGKYKESSSHSSLSIKLYESIKCYKGLAYVYTNLGANLSETGNNKEAIDLVKKAYVFSTKSNELGLASLNCFYLGDFYLKTNDVNNALEQALLAKKIAEQIKSNRHISYSYLILGKIYRQQKNYQEAIEAELKSVELISGTERKLEVFDPLSVLSKIYYDLGDYSQSIKYGEQALLNAQKMESPLCIKESTEALFKSYFKTGNVLKAYQIQTMYYNSRDSILNQTTQKEILINEFKRQTLTDSLKHDAEKKLTAVQNQSTLKAVQNKLVVVALVLLLMVVLGIVLLNRYKVTQKQKQIIENQSKEIQDSISYSKEIQTIFLKSIANNRTHFKDVLLIYKPKDVVSGDFYWYKEVEDNLFVVVGDCTGHGVPGAIISVLAIQSLEKLISNIKNPQELHQLNSLLRDEFNFYYHQDSRVSIGLDYSILCINKTMGTTHLSGSGSSVLVKDKLGEVIVERFDSINIGGKSPVVYIPKTATLDMKQIDSIYLYTDGVVDQRGGRDNKKFGTKQLTELVKQTNTLQLSQELSTIEKALDKWRDGHKQIDDITLLGLQLNAI